MKNDYYVYLHKTLDGKVFYVGKGRGKRAWQTSNRSKSWINISTEGYSIEIYKENLMEKEALELENNLISELEGLVNRGILSPVGFDDYSEYFIYDPASPSGLVRVKNVRGGKLGPCGSKATRSCGGQHWLIGFKRRTVHVHRIIWQLVHGKILDGFIIDHIDGNALNNRIENLRMISQAENSRNTRKRTDRGSGVVGVYFYKDSRRNSSSHWCASFVDLNGKLFNKSFSVFKYGYDEAFQMACEYRKQKINELNEQGAGYTERHGK